MTISFHFYVRHNGSTATKKIRIDGSVHGRRDSIANALELRLSYINPQIEIIFVYYLIDPSCQRSTPLAWKETWEIV